jgi:hypothetical protein
MLELGQVSEINIHCALFLVFHVISLLSVVKDLLALLVINSISVLSEIWIIVLVKLKIGQEENETIFNFLSVLVVLSLEDFVVVH